MTQSLKVNSMSFFSSSKDEIKQQQELTALMTNATEHKGTDVTTFNVSLLRRCSLSLNLDL